MKQVLQYPKRGELHIEEVPRPALKVGGVVIRNQASLLSAGTERSIIEIAEKSLLGKAKERPDLVRQVIQKVKTEGALNTYRKVKSRLDSPLPLGYSCAGVVTEVSPEILDLTPGQRVAAAGFGYASHAEMVFVPKNLTAPVPDNVTLEEASFVTLGAIALQGVRQANPTLGETIAVIGLGLLGQLATQMLRANGCRTIGLDIDQRKIDLAESLGCTLALNNGVTNVTEQINDFTGGVGVDRVIITAAGTTPAIMNLAAGICRDRGQITVVGAVNMDLDRRPFYNKELSLNLSRSYGPGRYDTHYEEQGQDYPISYVRWTERRNMVCFLQMISDRQVNVRELITHRYDVTEAPRGYDLIMGRKNEDYLAVVINYPTTETSVADVSVTVNKPASAGAMSLAALGTGNFSTGVLYPILKTQSGVRLRQIVATNGMKAMNVARQFGFEKAGVEFNEVLEDRDTTAVLIATPHNQHAEQVIAALHSNKDVFVEKPLATTAEELRVVKSAFEASTGKLMVGFNRRFSPAARKIRSELAQTNTPGMFLYRINAGFIPADHPLQDDRVGKGRIIGEVCHFIDLITYLSGGDVCSVRCDGVAFTAGKYITSDNINIQLKLTDGSSAIVQYVACGGAGLSKEYFEAHTHGVSYVIDDFKRAVRYSGGKETVFYRGGQDKGHKGELEAFASLSANSPEMTQLTQQAFAVTGATLAVVEALRSGETVVM